MNEILGLSRDPFALVCDGSLYWEDDARKEVRRSVLSILRAGEGVWLSGPEAGCTPEAFLAALREVISGVRSSDELPSAAEATYASLIESFSEAGTIVCFPGLEQPTVGALAEVVILSRFRIAGRSLVALALVGGGDSPFPGLARVSLPAPSRSDLRSCLRHRASMCGNSDALSADALDRIASTSRGFGDAIRGARRALARAAFQATLSPAGRDPAVDLPETEARAGVLDPAQLDELTSLLESLSPGH